MLNKSDIGYEATLSMLLSAQATQRKVTVRVESNEIDGKQFCHLNRVVIHSK